MENTIKKINMEILFESILNLDARIEEEVEKKCLETEDNQEFKGLFFFHDDKNNYFYQKKDELKIKEFIQNNIDKDIISDDGIFMDYGKYLQEYENNCDDINFEFNGITIKVEEDIFYTSLEEDILNDNEIVEKLVKADNFNDALSQIKRDCLLSLVKISYSEIIEQIKEYEF